jgi:hypothetical protein
MVFVKLDFVPLCFYWSSKDLNSAGLTSKVFVTKERRVLSL